MHMKKIRYVFIAAMTVIAMSCAKESLTVENESQSYSDAGGLESVAGEVVVKFDESLSDILDRLTASGRVQTRSSVTSIDRVLDLIDGYEIERVFPVDPSVEEQTRAAGLHLWYVVRFGEGHTVDEVMEKLSELGEVQDASPVRTIKRAYNAGKKAIPLSPKMMGSSSRVLTKADGMPFDDELLKYQWHLLNNGWTADYVLESGYDDIVFDQDAAKAKFEVGADVNVAPAWKKGIQGDPAIIVAILDEAICLDHEDLKESIWVNEGETWNSDKDADGNGYAGDVYGYNFITDSGVLSWSDISDTGHGSHVAGVIAAVNNNGTGISSIAGGTPGNPGVRLMSCQVFSGNQTSTTVQLVKAIKYAADNGAVILQCSWGYLSGKATCSTGEGAASLPKRSGRKHARWKSLSSTISCTTQARLTVLSREAFRFSRQETNPPECRLSLEELKNASRWLPWQEISRHPSSPITGTIRKFPLREETRTIIMNIMKKTGSAEK